MRSSGVVSSEMGSKMPVAMRDQVEVGVSMFEIFQMSPSRVERSPVPSDKKAMSVGRMKRSPSGKAMERVVKAPWLLCDGFLANKGLWSIGLAGMSSGKGAGVMG